MYWQSLHVLIYQVKQEIKCTFENAYVRKVKAQKEIKNGSIRELHLKVILNVFLNGFASLQQTNLKVRNS